MTQSIDEVVSRKPKQKVVHSIDVLSTMLGEIKSSLKHLDEGQRIIVSLVEASAEHNVEIKHLNASMERVYNELKAIDNKMACVEGKIENILAGQKKNALAKEEKIWFGARMFELAKTYWHIGTILASLLLCVVTYVFGLHLKDGL